MENTIDLQPWTNPYLEQFQLAQRNFNLLIREERILKRVQKSKMKPFASGNPAKRKQTGTAAIHPATQFRVSRYLNRLQEVSF